MINSRFLLQCAAGLCLANALWALLSQAPSADFFHSLQAGVLFLIWLTLMRQQKTPHSD